MAACWGVRWATLRDAASTSFTSAPMVGMESEARPRPLPARERKPRREVSGFIGSCPQTVDVCQLHTMFRSERTPYNLMPTQCRTEERFYERDVKKKVSPRPPKVLGS